MARQDEQDALPPSGSTEGVSSAPAAKDARAERLAAALRENLRRRKAQARGRRTETREGSSSADDGNT